MELDIIKLQTTWNDAASAINSNFAKLLQAINAGVGNEGFNEEELRNFLESSGYTTEEWVLARGYITASSLVPYAKKEDLSSYATKGELTSAIDGLNISQYATKAALSTLQGQHDTLRSEFDALNNLLSSDTEDYINTWNEVVAFLDGYKDESDLATILSGMNGDIASRLLTSDFESWKTNTFTPHANLVANHTTRLDGLDQSILSINTRFDGVDKTIEDHIAEFTAFRANFEITDNLILVRKNFASTEEVSAKGINQGTGGGGGSSYSRLDTWDGYDNNKAGYVLSAGLGYGLKVAVDELNGYDLDNRVRSIENSYVSKDAGGVVNGGLVVSSLAIAGGTSSQFLKADGSLDGTSYLSTSGGTIKKAGNAPLFIEGNVGGSWVGIGFKNDNGIQGFLGANNDTPVFINSTLSESYTLLHNGNVGDYAAQWINYGGDSLAYYHGVRFFTKYESGVGDFCDLIIPTWVANTASDYYTSILRFRINGGIEVRNIYNGSDNAYQGWKTIAFTDSNVASADYATNADMLDYLHSYDLAKANGAILSGSDINHIGYGYPADGNMTVGPMISYGANSTYFAEIQSSFGDGTLYYRIHNGNGYGSVKHIAFTDSNVASADKASFLTRGSGDIPANDRGSLDYTYALYTGGWANSALGYASIYGTYIDLSGYATWYHRLAFNTTGEIEHFMGINTTTLTKVGSLAYLSSNVASATKLATPRTIWGQSFDGTGNVDGDIELLSANKLYWADKNNYYIGTSYTLSNDGLNLDYRAFAGHVFMSSSGKVRMLINSAGNVTIGDSDYAGASRRLYVDGYVKIAINKTYDILLEKAFGDVEGAGIGFWNNGWQNATISASTLYLNAGSSMGNVLIGTTTDNGAKLQVDGAISTLHIKSTSGLDITAHNEGVGSRLFLTSGVFRPWGADAGQIDFGSSDVRWRDIYANGLNINNGAIISSLTVTGGISSTSLYVSSDIITNRIIIGGVTLSTEDGVLKIESDMYATGEISAHGLNKGESGGGGSSYSRLDTWGDYDSSKAGYVLSAGLGYDLKLAVDELNGYNLNSRLTTVESNYLSKNGGTINGTIKIHNVAGAYNSVIEFSNTSSYLGALGVSSYNRPVFYNGAAYEDILTTSGGTVKASSIHPLTIDTYGEQIGIYFSVNGSIKTEVGWDGSNGAYLYNYITGDQISLAPEGGAKVYVNRKYENILHTGNIGSYALKTDGSNVMTGHIRTKGYLEFLNTDGTSLGVYNVNAGNNTPIYLFNGAWKTIAFTEDVLSTSGGKIAVNSGIQWGDTNNVIYATASTMHIDTDSNLFINGNQVIHEGNIGSQSVAYASTANFADTSNYTNGFVTDASSLIDLNNLATATAWYYGQAANGILNKPDGFTNGAAFQIKTGSRNELNAQFAWDVNHNSVTPTKGLWFRANNNLGWGNDWKTIAFTDSNITGNAASATKLNDNTAYTIWGNTFFENGKPNNVTNPAIMRYLLFSDSDGGESGFIGRGGDDDSLFFRSYKNAPIYIGRAQYIDLLIKDGNVGIGTASPSYKLDVIGDIRATESITIGGATLSWENGALKVNTSFYSEKEISAKGLSTGGGSGASYNRLDAWGDYDSSKAGYVLSAGLGYDLNTRLSSLSGVVDTHTSRLSSLENAGYITSSALSGYLPLSGGTIESTFTTPLTILTTTEYSTIRLHSTAGYRTFGTNQSGDLFVSEMNGWNKEYIIVNSGNIGDYAITPSTIGSQSVAYASNAGNANTVGGWASSYGSNKPFGTIPTITTSGYMDIGGWLEFHYDNYSELDFSTILMCTGNYQNVVYLPSASGTLALLTDNVASATKLATARTIWGQSFDGTGNVSGDLSDVTFLKIRDYDYGIYKGNYFGGLAASDIVFTAPNLYFYTSKFSMLINSAGNVTIGATDLASSSYRLYVDGTGYFSGALTANGGLTVSGSTTLSSLTVSGTTKSERYLLSNSEDSYCGLMPNSTITLGGNAGDIWLYNNQAVMLYGGKGVIVTSSFDVQGATYINSTLSVANTISSADSITTLGGHVSAYNGFLVNNQNKFSGLVPNSRISGGGNATDVWMYVEAGKAIILGESGIDLRSATEIASTLTVSGNTELQGDLRLRPSGKDFGSSLKFGDGSFCCIQEDTNDHMKVTARHGVTFESSEGTITIPKLSVGINGMAVNGPATFNDFIYSSSITPRTDNYYVLGNNNYKWYAVTAYNVNVHDAITIEAGKELRFKDDNGVVHTLKYDSTKQAFVFDGNVNATGEMSAKKLNA